MKRKDKKRLLNCGMRPDGSPFYRFHGNWCKIMKSQTRRRGEMSESSQILAEISEKIEWTHISPSFCYCEMACKQRCIFRTGYQSLLPPSLSPQNFQSRKFEAESCCVCIIVNSRKTATSKDAQRRTASRMRITAGMLKI